MATYDRQNINLYIDGVLSKTSENVSGSILQYGDLKFGYLLSDNLKGFDGYLDEIKLYEKALTYKEVENRYNAFKEQLGLVAH